MTLPLGPGLTVPRRGPLLASVVLGAIGVASLPLALVFSDRLAVYYLSLAGTLAVAAVGDATGQPWLRWAGLVVTAVAAASPVVGFGAVLVAMIALGPLAVVVTVGGAIRLADPFAGTAFLSACAIAITAGFVAAPISPAIALGVGAVVLAGGTATTLSRL